MVVGANLRMMRTANKMSQTALGDQVGVTFQQIQKYERGDNRIGASRMWQLCQIFSCKPGDFFAGLTGKSVAKPVVSNTKRTELFKHPRGPAIAEAFLNIENIEFENQIIAMCRTLANQKSKTA